MGVPTSLLTKRSLKMRSFHYLAIFTIVKFNLVFSTLVDQDTNSDEEFEDIFYHKSSKDQNHIKFAATMMENNQLLHDFRYSWSSNDSLDNSKIGLADFPLSRFEDFPMTIMMLPLIMSTVFVIPLIIFL